MPIIDIAKIQYRHGKKIQLPLLDTSEIAFATDTGEVFIGPDPAQATSNIKVVTEFDLPKQLDGSFYPSSAMVRTTLISDGSVTKILEIPLCASFIAYFTFVEDATNNKQMGELLGIVVGKAIQFLVKRYPLYEPNNEIIKNIDSRPTKQFLTRSGTVSIENRIPKQIVTEGTVFNYTVPDNTFQDDSGNALVYSAFGLDDGGNNVDLPSWLTFTVDTKTFDGTVVIGQINFRVNVVATDSITTDSASTEFFIVINHNPQVANPIPDQSIGERLRLLYTIPDNTFLDPETSQEFQGETLIYDAYIVNSDSSLSSLPAWLILKNTTLDGIVPSETPNFKIRIVASDGFGGSAYCDFNWTVIPNQNPVVTGSLQNQVATVGIPMSYQIPSGTFSDPDNDTLIYSAFQLDSQGDAVSLPSWLIFDKSTLIFSGTATSDALDVNVRMYADDNRADPNKNGDPATADFTIVINHPPAMKIQPSDYTYNIGDTVDITLDPGTFVDQDNDTMTFTAYQIIYKDELDLPSWLSFDSSTLTFSGIVPQSAKLEIVPSSNQSRTLRVKANDGRGGITNVDFKMNINTIQNRLSFRSALTKSSIQIFASLTIDSNDNTFGSDGVISVFMNHW